MIAALFSSNLSVVLLDKCDSPMATRFASQTRLFGIMIVSEFVCRPIELG